MKSLAEKRQEFFEGLAKGGALNAASTDLGIVAHKRVADSSDNLVLVREENGQTSCYLVEKGEGETIRAERFDDKHNRYSELRGHLAFSSSTSGSPSYYWIDNSWMPVNIQPWPWTFYPNTVIPFGTTTTGNFTVEPTPEPNLKFEIASAELIGEDNIHKAEFAKAGIEKQPDLLYVRFKLMHEGGNKNLDWFDSDELKIAAHTPIHKPLNWDHKEPTIGHIYYSEFVPAKAVGANEEPEGAHIIAEAAVYKFRYPEFASKMVSRYATKTLAFSMEAYFTEAQCSQCGEVFAAKNHPEGTYCEHLNNRFQTLAKSSKDDKSVYRKLKKFILGGAGVVEDPADVGAEALALARTKEERTLNKIELTQAELDAKIEAAVKDALSKANTEASVQDLEERMKTAEASVQEQKTALESAKATILSLTAERDEAKAEVKKLQDKATYEAKASKRQAALAEAGYVAPENDEEAVKAFALIMDMSDDVFDLFTLQVKAGAKKEEKPNKPAGTTQASTRIPASGGVPKAPAAQKSASEEVGELLARL